MLAEVWLQVNDIASMEVCLTPHETTFASFLADYQAYISVAVEVFQILLVEWI